MVLTSPAAGDLERALAEEVRTHAQRDRLAALCFELLSAQAEERNVSFSKRSLRPRASYRAVPKAESESSLGNVLAILERGPERSSEWAILAAFAVQGLELRLSEVEAPERRELVERFVRHLDFLELSTPYAPYRFVRELLSDASRIAVIEALETGMLAPSDGPSLPAFRARVVLRICALKAFACTEADQVLGRIAQGSPDEAVRAAALQALGKSPNPDAEDLELRGDLGSVATIGPASVLAYVTGLSLLRVVWRALLFALGVERFARVRCTYDALHVHRELRLFGKTVRVSDEAHALRDLEGATCIVTTSAVAPLVAAGALGLGLILFLIWGSDGLARDDSSLLMRALIALAIGAAIDLAITGVGRIRPARAGLEIRADRRRVLSLHGIEPARARQLVDRIAYHRH